MDLDEHLIGCAAAGGCPSPTAHRRLEAAHLQWHRCLDAYYDPALFITDLNALIQTLRNVTFVLQKEMSATDGFKEWYEPWQEAMKRDPLMKWTVQARNKIVKEGDLQTRSNVEARVVFAYPDAAQIMARGLRSFPDKGEPVSTELMLTKEEILERAQQRKWPQDLLDQAIAVIERRWVDEELGDIEVLEALARVFSFASSLVLDMDVQFSTAPYDPELDPENMGNPDCPYPELVRPVCMRTTRSVRSLAVRLVDVDEEIHGLIQPAREMPNEDLKLAAQKYGGHIRPGSYRVAGDPFDAIPWWLESGRAILLSGESHGWMVLYFQDDRIIGSDLLSARDKADKYSLSLALADRVITLGADGIVMISESWQRTPIYDDDGTMIGASEKPVGEAVVYWVMTQDGREAMWLLPFQRSAFGIVTVEEPVQEAQGIPNFLAPVRAAWAARARST